MAEIKRVNYFTYQFLVEKDFTDEQAYHLGMRRRHNRLHHIWGVRKGSRSARRPTGACPSVPAPPWTETARKSSLTDATQYPLTVSTPDSDVY